MQPINVPLPAKTKEKRIRSERLARRKKNIADFGANSLRTARDKPFQSTIKVETHYTHVHTDKDQ